MSFPKVLDLYPFCTEDLKKSLDQGREFERKLREEEDTKMLNKEDVEMKDSKEETKGDITKPKKREVSWEEIKAADDILYRPHGLGLDTGHY